MDGKEKKEEGKIIHGEVEVVVEGEVETKDDEAEGINEEAEVEISNRHESTPVCVLKVARGSGTGPALTGVIDQGRSSKVGCVGEVMSL